MSEQTAVERSAYLTFGIGDELFALGVNNVREVLDVEQITRIPRMPDFVRGVINLRGSLVPVVDLRKKLGMQGVQDTDNACIIVVEVSIDGEAAVIGALADSVQAVLDLAEIDIEPPPGIGPDQDTDHIYGMGKHDDHLMIILDIDRIFSARELFVVKRKDQIALRKMDS